jgi:hypothetical protein
MQISPGISSMQRNSVQALAAHFEHVDADEDNKISSKTDPFRMKFLCNSDLDVFDSD